MVFVGESPTKWPLRTYVEMLIAVSLCLVVLIPQFRILMCVHPILAIRTLCYAFLKRRESRPEFLRVRVVSRNET